MLLETFVGLGVPDEVRELVREMVFFPVEVLLSSVTTVFIGFGSSSGFPKRTGQWNEGNPSRHKLTSDAHGISVGVRLVRQRLRAQHQQKRGTRLGKYHPP